MESEVDAALILLMEAEGMFSSDHVKKLVCNKKQVTPTLKVPLVKLEEYNLLLTQKEVAL